MSLLEPGGANYIGVLDIAAATTWYCEKLGLRKVDIEVDDAEHCVTLGFTKEECSVCLGPPNSAPQEDLVPILYSSNVKKVRELLSTRGVNVSEMKQDRQGTHYFEMRDLEGNVIEITEMP